MNALLPLATWIPILDGDEVAAQIYLQHYASERSRARRIERATKLILGPGQKLMLSTPCRRALFAWRIFIDDCEDEDGRRQEGVNCAVFWNAGAGRASDLIRAADAIADRRWPGQRHYTYVDPTKVGGDPAGNCFRHAGWRECGKTKARGLLILERLGA